MIEHLSKITIEYDFDESDQDDKFCIEAERIAQEEDSLADVDFWNGGPAHGPRIVIEIPHHEGTAQVIFDRIKLLANNTDGVYLV